MIAAFVTDFADQAVVLPLAVAVCLGLLGLGWRRGAAAWGISVGGVLAVMFVLKMVVLACGWRTGWSNLVSPSGHTAAAAVVYGGLLALVLPRTLAGTGAAVLAGGGMALIFGLTRLALHVHTVSDVVVGASVGVAGAIVMRWLAGANPNRRMSPRLGLVVLTVMFVFHGHRLEAESRIRWLALDVWPLSLCRK